MKMGEEEGEEGEEKEEDVEEEYLQTANWQLGNRRVRCRLMSDTRKRERKEVETHLHRMDCLHTLPSGLRLKYNSDTFLFFLSRVVFSSQASTYSSYSCTDRTSC